MQPAYITVLGGGVSCLCSVESSTVILSELNQHLLYNPSLPGEKELKPPYAQLQLSSC